MLESTLLELVIVLGSATVVATIFHSLRLPTIVGFIATGMLIGPYALGWVGSVPGAQGLTDIAILFLMFTLGLEFSPRKVIRLRRAFLGTGLVQVFGTIGLFGGLCFLVLSMAPGKSLFIGCLVAMSSTAIVMKLLEDARELHSPFGEASLGTLLFQDLSVLPLMVFLPLLAGDLASRPGAYRPLLVLPALLAGLWFGGRFAVPWIFGRAFRTRSREVFFFAVLSLCLGIAWIVNRAGLSLSFGAFLAGLIISDTPYVKQIGADFIHLRDNFLGLFFTSLGMLLNPAFLWSHLFSVLAVTAFILVGKGAITYAAARAARYPRTIAGICALTLSQVGEFSFVLATQGVGLGILTEGDVQFFLSASLLSILLTPFLYRLAPRWFLGRLQIEESSHPERPEAHTLILGFGPVGRDVAGALRAIQIPYRVLEMNPDVVAKALEQGEDILLGDGSREVILEAAGIEKCKLVILSVSGLSMTRAAYGAIRRIRPEVPIIVRAQYLRELEEFPLDDNTEVVVAEFETSIEMLIRTLRANGVSADRIDTFIKGLRGRLEPGLAFR